MNPSTQNARSGQRPPFAVVLGTNEIASAVGVKLFRSGFFVVLSHDPSPPVIRRKMAFHDALFDDPVAIGGVKAKRADTGLDILAGLRPACHEIMITELGLLDLIVLRTLDVLIDARMQKYQTTPDLRPLARLTIGLGPGFGAGTNCDCAVETRPAKTGHIIEQGATDPADGIARSLGGTGHERFVYSPVPGRWHTAIEIGTRVFKDFIIGHLGSETMRAPFDGILRGVARDGIEVPAGVKLLEIDPRGRRASWTGIDKRSRMIAVAVMKVIAMHRAKLVGPFQRTLTVVK
jgi:hypothetical protein